MLVYLGPQLKCCHHMCSDLSEENFHHIADHTLDRLLESLEELIDTRGDPSFEVDYSVRALCHPTASSFILSKRVY